LVSRGQINESSRPEDIKDALRSLRARLKVKNVGVQMLALTLLEALMKNCGPEFHLQVAVRDFMGELAQLALPGDADRRVMHKVQQLLQAWGEAFAEMRREMPLFYDTYQELRERGVQFPPFDPSLAPSFIGNSSRTAEVRAPTSHSTEPSRSPAAQSSQGASAAMAESMMGRGAPSGAAVFDVDMLKADLEKVHMEVTLLTDMLTAAAADTNKRDPAHKETDKLIKELARNCSTYQLRVVSLIEEVPESVQEDVIPLLLQANEEILRSLELHSDSSQLSSQKAPALPPPPAKGNLRPKSALKNTARTPGLKGAGSAAGAALAGPQAGAGAGDEEDLDLQMLLGPSSPASDTSHIAAAPAQSLAERGHAVAPVPLPPPPPRHGQDAASPAPRPSSEEAGDNDGWGDDDDDLADLLGSIRTGAKGVGVAGSSAAGGKLPPTVEAGGQQDSAGPAGIGEGIRAEEDAFDALARKDEELEGASRNVEVPECASEGAARAPASTCDDTLLGLGGTAAGDDSLLGLGGTASGEGHGGGEERGLAEVPALPLLSAPPKAGAAAAVAASGGEQAAGADALATSGTDDLIKF
jgi:hypothetical protein